MSNQDKDFQDVFQVSAKIENSEGDEISCNTAKEWLNQAGIIGEKLSADEAEEILKTVSKDGNYLNEKEFQEFIDKIASTKDIFKKELMEKIITTGRKITSNATEVLSHAIYNVKDMLSKRKDFHAVFQVYAKSGNSEGDEISCDIAKEWLKQAGIINGKISAEEVEKIFKTVSKGGDNLNEKEFTEFIDKIASEKGMDEKDIVDDIITTGGKTTSNVIDPTM